MDRYVCISACTCYINIIITLPGNHRDSDVELLILCNHWYSNLNRALVSVLLVLLLFFFYCLQVVVDYTDYDPLLPLM